VEEPVGGVPVAGEHRADITRRPGGVKLACSRGRAYDLVGNTMVGILPRFWLLGGPWRGHGTDCLALLKAARRAQQTFEATRRANLPVQPAFASDRCDERIGRMCYWYEGGLDTAPEEPPRIREARVRLLATLADASVALPGDEWIAGQRVRYLIEHQAFDAAVHLARRTFARIEREARTTFGLYWGDDLRDLLVRYGWATYWTREPPRSELVPSEPRIAGHEPSPSLHFGATMRAFDDPGGARPDDWVLDPRRARERYAPAYARAFVELDHQAAVFRRADSCVVVGAYDLSGDTLFAGDSVTGALVLAADDQTVALSRDSGVVRGTRALTATAPCQPFVLSLEALAPREKHVARARYGVTPPSALPNQVEISDLLLFDPPDSVPDNLSAVIPRAYGATRFSAPHRVGVFWELY